MLDFIRETIVVGVGVGVVGDEVAVGIGVALEVVGEGVLIEVTGRGADEVDGKGGSCDRDGVIAEVGNAVGPVGMSADRKAPVARTGGGADRLVQAPRDIETRIAAASPEELHGTASGRLGADDEAGDGGGGE